MNDFIHTYCGSDDVYFCREADLYKCDCCHEYIIDADELITKRAILDIDNSDVVVLSQEAA